MIVKLAQEGKMTQLCIIGQGSFGIVFRGMKDGLEIAVKVLNKWDRKEKLESDYIEEIAKGSPINKQFIVEVIDKPFFIG